MYRSIAEYKMKTAQIFEKYSSMTVIAEDLSLEETLGDFFNNIADEIGVSAYKEFEDIANAFIEEGIDATDEQQLAFLTFLYEVYNTQELEDYEDENIKFEFEGKVLFDGTINELQTKYGKYLG